MGCRSDYLEPNVRQQESVKVIGFLRELKVGIPEAGIYGDVGALDEQTAILCGICNRVDVTQHSLELQIWWRDHQIADKKREEAERKKALAESIENNPSKKSYS